MSKNNHGKRMVPEYLIKKLEELDPSGGSYTAGAGISIEDETISIDTSVVATKTDLADYELKSEAFSGDYDDLTDKPDLSIYAQSANLATVATTGDYDDLTDKPVIPDAVSGTNDGTNWTSLTIGSDTYDIPAGGGSSYTFTNGLTESSGTVSWDLNDRIKVGAGNYSLKLGNSADAKYCGLATGLNTAAGVKAFAGGYSYEQGSVISNPQSGIIAGGDSTVITYHGGQFAFGTALNKGRIFASGAGSTALGCANSTSGGYGINASGNGSFVQGYSEATGKIEASGAGCFAQGSANSITGNLSASGTATFAHGEGCSASGEATFATGIGCSAKGYNGQVALGKYNVEDTTSLFIIGNGTSNGARSNAMKVDTSGNMTLAGSITASNIPAVDTTTDGTYVLKATVSSGVVTYAWVLEQ